MTRKVGPKGARQSITEYAYFANVAVALGTKARTVVTAAEPNRPA